MRWLSLPAAGSSATTATAANGPSADSRRGGRLDSPPCLPEAADEGGRDVARICDAELAHGARDMDVDVTDTDIEFLGELFSGRLRNEQAGDIDVASGQP